MRPPGRWGHPGAKAAKEVSTDPGAQEASAPVGPAPPWPPSPGRSPQASACEPHREWIEEAVRNGRLARAIWQDLVDDRHFRAGYASVRRFVAKLRAEAPREAHPRIETPPGQEAQVDYGDGPMVRDPGSGKYRRTRLFVLTLGYSRKAVRLLTWKSSTRIWAELHERAFRRLGGATSTVGKRSTNPMFRSALARATMLREEEIARWGTSDRAR